MPVTVVTGERDAKFRALGERMAAPIPDAALVIVPGGHVLPLESPAAIAGSASRTFWTISKVDVCPTFMIVIKHPRAPSRKTIFVCGEFPSRTLATS